MRFNILENDTICALSSPPGMGAIAIVRLSGEKSHEIVAEIFEQKNKKFLLSKIETYKAYYGQIIDKEEFIDDVLVLFFKKPHSYTGENVVEINCHGSIYIQQRLLEIFIQHGARLAEPGEFSMRAFTNGKFDLAQAEAIADLIASQSKAAHNLAVNQMRGGFSKKISTLRNRLLEFASLIELELDFSEEDVEFVDRNKFFQLIDNLKDEIIKLIKSFTSGNVIKNGIPVAIIGKTNVGKSTLLNAILNEERALVSDIPGTTRDTIEDTIVIGGFTFRFIDTAGLRISDDTVENMGIERTYDKIKQASILLYVCDLTSIDDVSANEIIEELKQYTENQNKQVVLIGNKVDLLTKIPEYFKDLIPLETVFISAKRKENINLISESLQKKAQAIHHEQDTIVSNLRHYQALEAAHEAILAVENGFNNNIPTDLIAIDLRQAIYHLGTITGAISNDEVLGSIFEKFCIGK
ncbi:MAG: tRNA uridine-5-carboxymethylaminomethyl(34) synthesis GTPase MnmE [Lentimicrobiaceae bacterium]|jgi:tRNA modification GTPase|nr:tRNA uridine-5-carboxymethylaminomethyl(34) synthesis GTPase MnmE [Lentimicrobiaceae bacterium]